MTTTLGLTQTLGKGFETRTLTCMFTEGSGWMTRCFTTWKGEESGELKFSDQEWFGTFEDCEENMERRGEDMEQLGWR